jgi:hypothetical protein
MPYVAGLGPLLAFPEATENRGIPQIGPDPGKHEQSGLEQIGLSVGHMHADCSAPERTGQQNPQGESPGDQQKDPGDDFPSTDESDAVRESHVIDMVWWREPEKLGCACNDHEPANEQMEHGSQHSFPSVQAFHSVSPRSLRRAGMLVLTGVRDSRAWWPIRNADDLLTRLLDERQTAMYNEISGERYDTVACLEWSVKSECRKRP